MLVQKAISVHQYSLSCPYTSCNLTTDLSHETRLAANLPGLGSVRSPLPPDVPLLTELFFLAHASIRIGWTPLISRHFETAQQLHQLEAQWQAHEAAGAAISADSQSESDRHFGSSFQPAAMRYCFVVFIDFHMK